MCRARVSAFGFPLSGFGLRGPLLILMMLGAPRVGCFLQAPKNGPYRADDYQHAAAVGFRGLGCRI